MSNIYKLPSSKEHQDRSTSTEDLGVIANAKSVKSSSIIITNIIRRNDDHTISHENEFPEDEDHDLPTCSFKSRKMLDLCEDLQELAIKISDLSKSDITESTTASLINQPEASESLTKNAGRKSRCKTNILKAMISFGKNNETVKNKIKPEELQKLFNVFKNLPNRKHLSCAFSDPNLQNIILENLMTTTIIHNSTQSTGNLDKQRINKKVSGTTVTNSRKSAPFIHPVIPKLNLKFLDKPIKKRFPISLNAQEKFRLTVKKATNQIDYLCRNCKFLHINEPGKNQPLLILDFDALLISSKTFSDVSEIYKRAISRFFLSMYRIFNIAVWSEVNMNTLISRLKNLDLFDQTTVKKVIFCLDETSTMKVYIPFLGNKIVKPLEIVWNLYPQYNKNNTIMVNVELKELMYKQFGVPIGKEKEDKLFKPHELDMAVDFLTKFMSTKHFFSKLNVPAWKQRWN